MIWQLRCQLIFGVTGDFLSAKNNISCQGIIICNEVAEMNVPPPPRPPPPPPRPPPVRNLL